MLSTDQDRYDQLYDTPHHKVAIVFGAGVQPNGEPTPYLKRRVETGASLYRHHKVDILLLSGDNRTSHYNEPVAMKKYAQRLGVPADRIVLDYGGYSTYDTCYRAHAIFGLREAVLVSHGYHLPRAMTTCNRLGVQSVGVATQPMSIPGRDYSLNYIVREVLSTDKAMVELLFRPKPAVLGVPEPIK
jgi:vancomycin permeability regulator SanA